MLFQALGRSFDAEWFLLQDARRSAAQVQAGDRQVLSAAAPGAPLAQRFAVWLNGRRKLAPEQTPGVLLQRLLSWAHALLALLALVAGGGAAQGLLEAHAGTRPTNLIEFLLVTWLAPLAALLLGLLLLLLRRGYVQTTWLAEAQRRLAIALGRLLRPASAQRLARLAATWRQLRVRAARYSDLEQLALVSASQLYPSCFHLGAALSLLRLALLSDLYFAWGTTFSALSPGDLHRALSLLSAPWASWWPAATPSSELVAATQFNRLSQSFAQPGGAELSGAWWPFLLACLLAYGVLPRLLLAGALRSVFARRAARLPERVLELRRRLAVAVEVAVDRGAGGADGAPAASASTPVAQVAQVAPGEVHGSARLITWRGAPLTPDLPASLERHYGLSPIEEASAGDSDFASDSALLQRCAQDPRTTVLVAEGWEAPDKAVRHLLSELREAAPELPIFVLVLVPPGDAQQLSVWRDCLALLNDPRLSVEPRPLPQAQTAAPVGAP